MYIVKVDIDNKIRKLNTLIWGDLICLGNTYNKKNK